MAYTNLVLKMGYNFAEEEELMKAKQRMPREWTDQSFDKVLSALSHPKWDFRTVAGISKEMGLSKSEVKEILISLKKLKDSYAFRDSKAVISYLVNHSSLIPLLLEAYGKIPNYFPHSQVFLQIVTDPEMIDDEQLVIYIGTDLAPDKAVDRLEALDENWWLDASLETDGELCIHLEFH